MFKYTYTIKKEDINLGNHVGNERALLFFQWAREKFFESLNLSELNIGEDAGVIQTDAYVQYKKQLFLDQTIEVIIENVRVEGLKIIFEYKTYIFIGQDVTVSIEILEFSISLLLVNEI